MTTFPTALSQALRELGFKTYGAQAMLLELHEGTWRRYYNSKTSPSSDRLSGWLRKLHDAEYPLRATWTVETGWVVTKIGAPHRVFWGTLPVVVVDVYEERALVALNLNDAYLLPGHPACEIARQPPAGGLAWICHRVDAADVRAEPFELAEAP